MKKPLSLLIALALACSAAVPASALEADEAKELLRTYYIGSLPANFDELETIEDILSALNDPYTDYLSPEKYDKMLESLNGRSMVGIGVIIQSAFQDG